MEKISLTPRALVTWMVNKSGLGGSGVSAAMGKERRFIADYTNKGRMPTVPLFTQIAKACGYEVHIIGHGEDITVEVPDEQG